ncbi:MAG: hypothetical protein GY826_39965, partial [Fuerstiella sp.]|nr:hypothetical protein [Fuerstiella sp.]
VIALVLMPIVVDDKYRADELMCYLPTARHQIVLARYVEAMIALFIGLAAHYGLGAILSNHIGEPGFRTLCSPQAVLVFCVVPVVFAALYLPCCFRLGLGRGSFVFAVISVILMTLITSPVFVTDVLSAGGGFVLTREMLQHPETVLVSLIDHVAAIVGKRRFFVTVSIGII